MVPCLTSSLERVAYVLRQPPIAFGLALIVLVWGAAFALVGVEQSANRRALASDTANLGRAFEQNAIRSLGEIDKTLLYLRHAHADGGGRHEWSDLFKKSFTSTDITFQLAVIDAKGWLVATDRGPQPPKPLDLSDRVHYRVHAQSGSDTLYISQPVLGRVTKQWSVQLTRRLSAPDGSFAGVIVASLDPEQFARFYRSIDLGQGGEVTLVGLDGVVRASGGPSAAALGSRLDDPALLEKLGVERAATVYYRSRVHGTERVASLRRVKDYPLAILVATNEWQAGIWTRNASFYLWIAAGISAIIAIALIIILRRTLKLAETRRALDLKSRHHEVTLESISQGILMVDGKGEVGFMNERLGELLGLPPGYSKERRSYRDFVEYLENRGEFHGALAQDVLDFIRRPQESELIPHYERQRPDGTVLEVRSTVLGDGGFVRTITDITGRRRAEAKVLQLARHDALTGLSNRAVFRQQLEEATALIAAGRSFAVLMIDLDRFKPVNDTHGHAVGDLLLKVVAERLRSVVRSGDIVGRLGGDEFAIIQMGVNRPEQASALAERVCRALGQPFTIDRNTLLIGASVGIAMAPLHGSSSQELLLAADLALYAAKSSSRGTHAVFHEQLHAEHCARRKLEQDLKRAIEEDQFELHYQPILSIGSNEVTAYEALIRWRHPERGIVPPLEFIPLAEETGLINAIGAWVLQTACNDISQREGKARIAINLSPVQFRDRNLVEMVIGALERSGLPPERLEIEITESALLQDDQMTQRHLNALRDLGVHITMDDFGTGYSSLAYLMSYPIQSLKIDRSFVAGLGQKPNPTAIVKTITTLAISLGLSTTAEGVETEDQLRLLRELGCTEAQGYYFSRPKPAAEILPPRSEAMVVDPPLRAAG